MITQDADSEKLTQNLGVSRQKKKRGEMMGVCPDCGGVVEHIEGLSDMPDLRVLEVHVSGI